MVLLVLIAVSFLFLGCVTPPPQEEITPTPTDRIYDGYPPILPDEGTPTKTPPSDLPPLPPG